jgi:hypothetical protein
MRCGIQKEGRIQGLNPGARIVDLVQTSPDPFQRRSVAPLGFFEGQPRVVVLVAVSVASVQNRK